MILLRYITREVTGTTTAISLVLLLVFLSGRFVKYLAEAAAGTLDTGILFSLILFRIPDFLQLILPLGLFISLLLVYGRLYLENEMRVFYSAGISRFQLLALTLVPVLMIALATGIISLWFSPLCLGKVERMVDLQSQRSELDTLRESQFQAFRQNRGVIYAEKIVEVPSAAATASPATVDAAARAHQLQNVYIFQQQPDSRRESAIIVADTGKQVEDERGRYVVLQNGYRLSQLRDDNTFELTQFVSYAQHIEDSDQNEFANIQLDAMPTDQLRSSNRADYQAMWQYRVSLMLLVPVVALIAIALGKVDPRQGRCLKILPAMVIYLVYLVVLNIVRDKLVKGTLPMNVGLWWVHLLFLMLGIVLFNLENTQYWFGKRKPRSETP